MKLRRFKLENVRSFLEPAEVSLDGDISILIGPNGGGKTNLLDTLVFVLRWFFVSSWTQRFEPNPRYPWRQVFAVNDVWNTNFLEKHSEALTRDQRLEIEIEVTNRDLENIAAVKGTAEELAKYADERGYTNVALRKATGWKFEKLAANQRVSYQITNGTVVGATPEAELFREYLSIYELDAILRDEAGRGVISMPMLSLPVNRAGGGVQSSIVLSSYNEPDVKKQVDAGTSRTGGSIGQLAVGRVATKFRLLQEKDNVSARTAFRDDPQISAMTKVLADLGYDWELETIDARKNHYDIRLKKEGASFLASAASSGEKELLTYVFGIYGLNVRDALIVIDEPELHLHPKWQNILLSLFDRLSKETNNQFLMATHSPVFVAPSSIQYVSRVFSEKRQSRIVRLNDTALPEPKHLFSIVNSQNNERMFFADAVVLVEGISDRLFFEAVVKHLKLPKGTSRTYEIIEVGGKNMFSAYEQLAMATRVACFVIADLDYAGDIGTPEIKNLFAMDGGKIKTKVINNLASLDGQTFFERLEEAVASGKPDDLRVIWEYIKSRRRKLTSALSEAQRTELDTFIDTKRTSGVFILKRGDLEAYLPEGSRSKDIDKLIRYLNEPGFFDKLEADARREVQEICSLVFAQ